MAPDHTQVVIELKAGTADRDAVGQILSYMGDLQGEAGGKVRGILVAGHFTDRAISARRAVPNVELRKYGFKFSFESVR
jgi:RecB family endonuclease NucS